ncbi:MAG TPA: hypothetical protein PKA63_11680 [Oligoflexia bacterium]|nr:hypothetical protein [Oligoflexia bacterium]HMP49314.1 hypothetical protein [Oligoflexia bacterium]
MTMWMKGVAVLVGLLIVVAFKSDYNTRAAIFVLIAGGLLFLGLKGRR